MKFRLMFIIIPIMMFIGCDTDTSGGGGSSQPTGKTFAVSNIMFDSLTYDLTADVNLADGTNITLTYSGKSVQTVVKGGKISLKFTAAFYAGMMGGRTYTVTFAADGYDTVSGSIEYWPNVSFDLDTYDEITIYNGGAGDFVVPEFTLKNYDSDKVRYGSSFVIYDTAEYSSTDNPTPLDINTSGWKFDDLMTFFKDAVNVGKSVVYTFTITPVCDNGDALASGGSVVYHIKSDVLIKSVLICNQSGTYVAKLYAEDDPSDSSLPDTAGGVVAYQWQSSSDGSSWTDIAGATAKSYELTSSNVNDLLNKYLRVQITQTYSGSKQLPVVSPSVKVLHTVVNAALIYNGSLKVGEEFGFTKISGTLTDELGAEYSASEFIFEKTDTFNYTAISSLEFPLVCKKDGFNDGMVKVFVTVQATFAESELPSLVSDPYQMSSGKARFAEIDDGLEFSLDGTTYSDMTLDEFDAEVGQMLTLRKKSSGTLGQNGYLKESDPLTLTVKAENIGKKTQGSGVIGGLELSSIIESFTLSRSQLDQPTITITPDLECAEGYWQTESPNVMYEYTWLIEGTDSSVYKGVQINDETHALVITKSVFAGDAYHIDCIVRIYNHNDEYDTDLDIGYANMTLDLR